MIRRNMAINTPVDYKTVSPTSSYELTIPTDVREDDDERVFSLWRPGSSVVLQTSSYRKENGEPVSAMDRMQGRMDGERLDGAEIVEFSINGCSDVAAFRGTDAEGVLWFYVYGVWPDLTVLFTVSGRQNDVTQNGDWAFEAVRSTRRLSSNSQPSK